MNRYALLNNAGNDADNPILSGLALRITLHKQDVNETLKKAWVQVGETVFYDITSLASVSAESITFDLLAGVHLQASTPAVKNIVHITTSQHRHARQTLYCASRPTVMVTVDGYNAEDPTKPFIWPWYSS